MHPRYCHKQSIAIVTLLLECGLLLEDDAECGMLILRGFRVCMLLMYSSLNHVDCTISLAIQNRVSRRLFAD